MEFERVSGERRDSFGSPSISSNRSRKQNGSHFEADSDFPAKDLNESFESAFSSGSISSGQTTPQKNPRNDLETLMRAWYSFKSYDELDTGLITPKEFREALKASGLKLGTKMMDKIMSEMISFTSDGKVDYSKMEAYVDNLSISSSNNDIDTAFNENAFTINPPSITDDIIQPDEHIKSQVEDIKKIIFRHNNRIHEAFMKYDRGKVKEQDFIKFLEMLGLPVNFHVKKVLKSKKEIGTCSFTELIKALRLPLEYTIEKELENASVPQPAAKRFPNKERAPNPIEYPPEEVIKRVRQTVVLPQSLKDTDVLAWKEDPKKQQKNQKGAPGEIKAKKFTVSSKFSIDNVGNESLKNLKMEKVNSLLRDYLDGHINATVFRTDLRGLGIEINHEIERLINGNERDGLLTFNQFHKALKLHSKGETHFEYEKETIHSEEKVNPFTKWQVGTPEKNPVNPQVTQTFQSSVKFDDFSPSSLVCSNPFLNSKEPSKTLRKMVHTPETKGQENTTERIFPPEVSDVNTNQLSDSVSTLSASSTASNISKFKRNSSSINPLIWHPEEQKFSPSKVILRSPDYSIDIISWKDAPKYSIDSITVEPKTWEVVKNRKPAVGSPIQSPYGTFDDNLKIVNPHHYNITKYKPKAKRDLHF